MVAIAVTSLLCLVGLQGSIKADNNNSPVFSVIPKTAGNQMNTNATYYDLKTTPNMQETISVTVNNASKNEVRIAPEVNLAKTNYNGVIDYQTKGLKSDKSLPYDISELVKPAEKETIIPGNSSRDITFKIKMPNKQYTGQLIGGIVFRDLNHKTTKTGISNDYAYVVGIVLHGSQEESKNKLSLGKVYPDQNNYRNVITAEVHNQSAKIASDLHVQTSVTKRGSSHVLYQADKKNQMIAPNSIFKLPTSLENQALKPGRYTIHIKIKGKKQHWSFNKDFTIKGSEAKKLNKKAVDLEKDYSWLYATIIGILGVLLIVIMLYIRKKKHDQQALLAEIKKLKEESKDN